jgi:hypothetical protein
MTAILATICFFAELEGRLLVSKWAMQILLWRELILRRYPMYKLKIYFQKTQLHFLVVASYLLVEVVYFSKS